MSTDLASMTLNAALKLNMALQGVSEAMPVSVFRNYGYDQYLIFLRAMLSVMGVPVVTSVNEFGTLVAALHSAKIEKGAALVLLDTDILAIGHSLRDPGAFGRFDSETARKRSEELLRALSGLAERTKGLIIVELFDIAKAELSGSFNSLMTDERRELVAFRNDLGMLMVSHPNLQICIGRRPVVNEGRFFDTGEFLISDAARDAARETAETFVAMILEDEGRFEPKKLIITDLDNTLWNGILGDDGYEDLRFDDSPKGKYFYLYQKFLSSLAARGIILAVSTKNSPEIVEEAFAKLKMICKAELFTIIEASWEPKSHGVDRILSTLNLLPNSAIFIDDNELELAEVAARFPEIAAFHFEPGFSSLFSLMAQIDALCKRRRKVTGIEERRTSYRSVVEFKRQTTAQISGKDEVESYLKDLGMKLEVAVASAGTKARAFELVNKTNQFNLNGLRLTPEEFEERYSEGAVILASLHDDHADYGIIACAIVRNARENIILDSAVLSCRVFSRNIEDAFFRFLFTHTMSVSDKPLIIHYRETPKNAPVRFFFERTGIMQEGASGEGSEIRYDSSSFKPCEFLGEIVSYIR